MATDELLDALVVGEELTSAQLAGEFRRAIGVVEVVVDGHDLVYQVGLVVIRRTRSAAVFHSPLVLGGGQDS